MKSPRTDCVTIIISALNEEKNIAVTTGIVSQSAVQNFDDYEILLFDDGSTDKTGGIADKLAAEDEHIKVFHHQNPACLGGVYKEGLKKATKDYIILVNGKNDLPLDSLNCIFSERGKADMIIPYTINKNERSVSRKFFSELFVWILNTLFGLRLKYYNHSVLHKKELVDTLEIKSKGYAFQAEILIKLIKAGHSYVELGVTDRFEKGIKTKAFKIQNIIATLVFFFRITKEIYFSQKDCQSFQKGI